MKIFRIPLRTFPDIVLHASESTVKHHPQYQAAKSGDVIAAKQLVQLLDTARIEYLRQMLHGTSIELLPVHALESEGVNQIPVAMADELSNRLELPVNRSIVQINSVGHTGASGFKRLANQACFDGKVVPGKHYLLVDDFVGQGGTLANLIGFIHSQHGVAFGATVLTGKPYSAKLSTDAEMIFGLRGKHGREFEEWWKENFGFDFTCLTRSEARYLEKSPNADAIRNRLIEAGLAAGTESIGSRRS